VINGINDRVSLDGVKTYTRFNSELVIAFERSNETITSVEIINAAGQTLKQQTLNLGSNQEIIQIGELNIGMYITKLNTTSGSFSTKTFLKH